MTAALSLQPDTLQQQLEAHANKQLLRLAVVGSVDDGKSTLIGRILYECNGLFEDQVAAVQRASAGETLDFALFTDGLRAEREQGITIDVAWLVALYDDILFLNVVRDPRAQVSSMTQSIIHDFDPLLNAREWVRAHDAARGLMRKYPERVLTIRYEDFLGAQEPVLRKVCGFFGIDYLPEMLDVSRSDEARRISTLSALWEANSSAPLPANIDKFKKTLSLEQIEAIETLAGEHMDFYGYQRMTQGRADLTEAAFERARQRSEEGKRHAWAELKRTVPRDYQLRRFRADYLAMLRGRLEASAGGRG